MRPLTEAQKRSLARTRGEFVDPPPVKANRASKFMPRAVLQRRDPSLRNKAGGRLP